MSANLPSVLMGHCYYRQRGGEDVSFETEASILMARGHAVHQFIRNNEDIATNSIASLARAAGRTVWSREATADLRRTLEEAKPDVAHFQNTFPLISPAVYHVCEAAGVPVIQTLRDYRTGCIMGQLHRDGRPCEDCVGRRVAIPGVLHGCYRGSRGSSAVVATMLGVHRALSSWDRVDQYVALSEFARRKFIEIGIPQEKICVKPNCVYPDPGPRHPSSTGDYLLYLGRLSTQKGLKTLVAAASRVPHAPLLVVGEGPLEREVGHLLERPRLTHVSLLGPQGREAIMQLIRGARAIVMPSEWYETFGRVVIEAFACGTPVIASRFGALEELVDHERTGLQFEPGDVEDLAAALRKAWAEPALCRDMGLAARAQYEACYTGEKNYEQITALYRRVMGRRV